MLEMIATSMGGSQKWYSNMSTDSLFWRLMNGADFAEIKMTPKVVGVKEIQMLYDALIWNHKHNGQLTAKMFLNMS